MACIGTLHAEGFAGTVIHGDFHLPDHVFFDESKSEPGVIDFADVTIYDPAHDLQCIVEIGEDEFFEHMMKQEDGTKDPTLLKRSKLRLNAHPLFVAGNIFAIGIEEQYSSQTRPYRSNVWMKMDAITHPSF